MRGTVKLTLIENTSQRKVTFKKRKAGLLKKVRELSALCDVEMCVVIYSQEKCEPEAVWPSPREVEELVAKYQSLDIKSLKVEKVDQESYLRKKIDKKREKLRKIVEKNEMMEMSNMMCQIEKGKPLSEFEVDKLKSFVLFVEGKVMKVAERIQELREDPRHGYNVNGGENGDERGKNDGGVWLMGYNIGGGTVAGGQK